MHILDPKISQPRTFINQILESFYKHPGKAAGGCKCDELTREQGPAS